MPEWFSELAGTVPAAVAVIVAVYLMLQFMRDLTKRHAESIDRKDAEFRESIREIHGAHMKACNDTIKTMRDINQTLGRVEAHISAANDLKTRIERHLIAAGNEPK